MRRAHFRFALWAGLALAILGFALCMGPAQAQDLTAESTVDSCGVTIDEPGSYNLSTDIHYDEFGGDCLRINTSNVVLYGENHSISSTYGDSGIVVGSTSGEKIENVSIRNLSVDGWENGGIRFDTVQDSRISDVRLTSNYAGLVFSNSGNNTLNGSVIEASTREAGVILRSDSTHNRISDTTIRGNDGGGILINSNNNTVSQNTITGNQHGGIDVQGGNTTITDNTIADSEGPGIRTNYDSHTNDISTNDIKQNNGSGIYLSRGDGHEVSDNTIVDNFVGINIDRSNDNSVSGNSIRNHNDTGIAIRGTSYTSPSNTLLAGNTLEANQETGILVHRGTDTVVRENSIAASNHGIRVGTEFSSAVNTSIIDTQIRNSREWALTIAGPSTSAAGDNVTLENASATDSTFSLAGRHVRLRLLDQPDTTNPHGESIGRFFEAENTDDDAFLNLTLGYQDSDLSGVTEEDLRLWREDGTGWGPVASSEGDSGRNLVNASISSFSTFGVFDRPPYPFVGVEITGSNQPVTAGDSLLVNATVINVGKTADAQQIELTDFEGTVQDSENLTLAAGESWIGTFEWTPTAVDNGEVGVSSVNRTDTAHVWVVDPDVVPITDCRSLDTSGETYVAVDNLSQRTSCLSITADNVTFDGYGHTIRSDDSATGISVSGRNVSVRNVVVNGWETGITPGSGNRFINTTVVESATGIYLHNSHDNTFEDVTVRRSGLEDLSGGYGIYLRGADNNSFDNTTLAENGGYGIYYRRGEFNTFTETHLRENGASEHESGGIWIRSGMNATLIDTTIRNGGGVSIDGNNNTLINTTVRDSVGPGLYIDSDLNLISNATVQNSTGDLGGGYGVYVRTASHNRLENILVNDSDGNGMYLRGGQNNTITDSTVRNSGSTGIWFRSMSNSTLINMSVSNSSGAGISIGDDDNTLRNVVVRGSENKALSTARATGTVVENFDIGPSVAPNTTLSFEGQYLTIDRVDAEPDTTPGTPIDRYFVATASSTSETFMNISFQYDESDVTEVNESDLGLWKYDGTWIELDATVNTTANVLTANASNFSTFGIFAGTNDTDSGDGVDSCRVLDQPGEYQLTATITNETADPCIDIRASNVTFDGAGHELDGVDGTGIAIQTASSIENVTIRNTSLTGWDRGIDMMAGHGWVGNNTAYNNSRDGIHVSAAYSVVSNNVAYDNGYSDHAGILVSGDNHVVDNNTAYNNSENGIDVSASDTLVTHNRLYNNSAYGIYLSWPDNNTVRNNVGYGNFGGIVTFGTNHTIANNTFYSGSNGIEHRAEFSLVSNNTVYDTGSGITINAANNSFVDNTAFENNNGIHLFGSISQNNVVRNNTLTGNRNGISLAGASNNTIEDNVLNENYDGIYLYNWPDTGADHNDIIDNTAQENRNTVIRISESVGTSVVNLDIGNSTAANTTLSFTGANVSVNATSAPPENPDAQAIDRYFTASSLGQDAYLDLTLQYEDGDITAVNESELGLWKYVTSWSSIDSAVNTSANSLTANVTEFGIFGAFGAADNQTDSVVAIDSCTTIDEAGEYELVTNITSATTCITITASDVVFDGNGYTLANTNTQEEYGVHVDGGADGVRNVTVRNVTVDSWFAGIRLDAVQNSRVERNHLKQNGYVGIWLHEETIANTIANNTVERTGTTGIDLWTAEDNLIRDNTITASGTQGIDIHSFSTNNTVVDNTISDTGDWGIGVWSGSERNTVHNNTIKRSDGIAVDAATNSIAYNTISSGRTGIFLRGGIDNSLHNNAIEGMTWTGIYVGANDTTITDTSVDHTGNWSVLVEEDTAGTQVENLDVGDSSAPNTTLSFEAENVRVGVPSDPSANPHADALGRYFEIEHAVTGEGFLDVTLQYDDSDVGEGEQSIRLWRNDGTGWAPVSDSAVDTERNVISATLTDLSRSTVGAFTRTAAKPYFGVEIVDSTHPVPADETLQVNATVTNLGSETATQDVTLRDFNGTVRTVQENLTLAGGENRTITLEWTNATVGSGIVTVSTDNHSDGTWVRVHELDVEPITSCRVIDASGDYVLAHDIIHYTTCLEITASDVDLDGLSHRIVLDGRYSAHGVVARPPRVHSRSEGNGAVTSGENKLDAEAETHSETLDVNPAAQGVESVVVRNLTVGWDGSVKTSGILFREVVGGEISETTVNGNVPIELRRSPDGLITENVGYNGEMWIRGSDNVTFSHNIVERGGTAFGVLQDSDNVTLVNNTARDTIQGIGVVWGSNDTTLMDNTVRNTSDWRLWIDGSSTGTVVDSLDIGASSAPGTTLSLEGRDILLAAVETAPANDDAIPLDRYLSVETSTDGAYMNIALQYEEQDVAGINESTLELWRHSVDDGWRVVEDAALDPSSNVVTANVTAFSTFGLFGAAETPDDGGDDSTGVDGGDNTTDDDGGSDSTSGTETRNPSLPPDSASFEVTIGEVASPVVAGDILTVSATVSNTGEENGSQDVRLEVGDRTVNSTTLTLDPTEQERVTLQWVVTDDFTGIQQVRVVSDNETASSPVRFKSPDEPAVPPFFTVGALETNDPVTAGEVLTVETTIRNTGDSTQSQLVALKADGMVIESVTKTLSPGAEETVRLEWQTQDVDAGQPPVTVESANDSTTRTVTVEPPEDTTPISDVEVDYEEVLTPNREATFSVDVLRGEAAIEEVEWRVDGEVIATGEEITQAFDEPGEYAVELAVTDETGTTVTKTVTVTVTDSDDGSSDDRDDSTRVRERTLVGGMLLVVLVGIGGYWYVRRRK